MGFFDLGVTGNSGLSLSFQKSSEKELHLIKTIKGGYISFGISGLEIVQ